MAQTTTYGSMSVSVKEWIDAAGLDLLDEDACLEAIFLASHTVAPGCRAEALEWGAAYLDMLRFGLSAATTAARTGTAAHAC